MEAAVLVVDIVLVNLVSQEEKPVLVCELDDILDILAREHLSGWVTRIDDYEDSWIAVTLTLTEGSLKFADIKRPFIVLVEVVAHLAEPKLG